MERVKVNDGRAFSGLQVGKSSSIQFRGDLGGNFRHNAKPTQSNVDVADFAQNRMFHRLRTTNVSSGASGDVPENYEHIQARFVTRFKPPQAPKQHLFPGKKKPIVCSFPSPTAKHTPVDSIYAIIITDSIHGAVDTREVQPHDANEKEQLGLASVKAEPGSTGTTTTTTGTRLLHGILSQHPQQHGLGVQNGYGRHLAGHAQMGQPSYTTATIATTSTPGSGSLPASPADSGVSDVESSTSSGGNEDANLLLKARLNPNSSLQPSLASHHSHLSSAALGRSACHSPGVYPSTAGFLPPSYHPHQHHPSQYHPHRGSSPHHQHGNHTMGPTMGPPHHHHHHQTQSLQHLHYRQPPTLIKYQASSLETTSNNNNKNAQRRRGNGSLLEQHARLCKAF
ncbi:hypothetical protein K0M31_012063 [Melipona bicolor]|uniref:Uncharacterized protein n=1 Tax=Melipona bicolor TaxID=60889 RepID=A0AA40GAZ2_9HYME|nr:hypothetical protein K0M31_012063 [Melipona bicolor]